MTKPRIFFTERTIDTFENRINKYLNEGYILLNVWTPNAGFFMGYLEKPVNLEEAKEQIRFAELKDWYEWKNKKD